MKKKITETSQRMQYLGTFIMVLLMLANGASNGWNSPSLPALLSTSTPLESGPLSLHVGSWIAANICLGSIVGAPIFGWVSEKFGRKMCAYCGSILQLIAWCFIAFARNHYHLYISRFLVGFGGVACFVVVPIYIAEISESKIRGFLGSMTTLCSNFGVFLAFCGGAFIPCLLSPWLYMPINVLFLIGFLKFPETPVYLAKKGLFQQAEESLRFYRGLSNHSNIEPTSFLEELKELRAMSGIEFYQHQKSTSPSDEKNTQENSTKSSNNINIIRKALVISQVIFLLQQFSGCYTMFQYTEMIFEKAGSTISPKASAIFVAGIQVFGSYISTLLIERAGRRVLMIISSSGVGLGLIVFGGYFHLDDLQYGTSCIQLLPLISFSFVIFIANCGIINLTYLVAAEILPPEVKSLGSSAGNLLVNIVAFIFLLYLPQIMDEIGLHVALYVFALLSLMGTAFIYFFLPETKGKSCSEIQALLS